MYVSIDLEHLQKSIRSLEQNQLSRLDRSFLIRLLRELTEATEKSPRLEGESQSIITVRIEDEASRQRLQEIDRQIDEQQRLREASEASTDPAGLEDSLGLLLDEAIHRIEGIYDAYFFLYESGQLSLAIARAAIPGDHPSWHTPRPRGLTYTVARLGQPVVVPDMASHPMFADTTFNGSIIGLPLKIGPRVVGVMTVARKPPREFTTDEIHILQTLADQAAIQVDTARVKLLAEDQVRIDATTGLHNRQSLIEYLDTEAIRAATEQTPFTLFLVEVQPIAEVQQRYGRPAADLLLVETATAAAQGLRQTDFVARFDETRWALVVGGAGRPGAEGIAARLMEAIDRKRFALPDQKMRRVSLTAGVAIYPENGQEASQLIAAAMQALNQAQSGDGEAIAYASPPA